MCGRVRLELEWGISAREAWRQIVEVGVGVEESVRGCLDGSFRDRSFCVCPVGRFRIRLCY